MVGKLHQLELVSGEEESSSNPSPGNCRHSSTRLSAVAINHISLPSNAVFYSSNIIRISGEAVAQPSWLVRSKSKIIRHGNGNLFSSSIADGSSSKPVFQHGLAVRQTTSAVRQSSVGNSSPFAHQTAIFRNSRKNAAHIPPKTSHYLEPPHVGCHCFPAHN
jgi:hypothetical protein